MILTGESNLLPFGEPRKVTPRTLTLRFRMLLLRHGDSSWDVLQRVSTAKLLQFQLVQLSGLPHLALFSRQAV